MAAPDLINLSGLMDDAKCFAFVLGRCRKLAGAPGRGTPAVVASDDTSVQVKGKTCWEWVFVTTLCVLHIVRPSRGAAVVRTLFGGQRPRVWVSDGLRSQHGHADLWQLCLAHLLRDAQYGPWRRSGPDPHTLPNHERRRPEGIRTLNT